MKLFRILSRLVLTASLLLLPSYSVASAKSLPQISGGQSCRKVGEVSGTLTTSFVCTKVGKKFVWRKVIVSQTTTTTTTTLPAVTMSTQVLDLNGFINTYAKSVVTVSCGNVQGSGVSVPFGTGEIITARGFQSMVVTNEHVIYECLTAAGGDVVVNVKYGAVEYVGYAMTYPSWNDVNAGLKPDLAAVYTTALIPQTSYYSSVQPVLGHAVVAVGSAGGVPNVTTRGEIAGVTATKIITTAPAGHGSSGGALFNNRGQLLGFITSANASLVEVTPITELCKVIFTCTTPIVFTP